jgi:hypothetical protein
VERQKGGDRSAVVKLAFVSAFMLPEGVSLEDAVGGPADWWIIGDVSIFGRILRAFIN